MAFNCTVTASEAVKTAKAQAGCDYWFACSGEAGTSSLLTSKIAQNPGMWSDARRAAARKQCDGKPKYDCVGLMRKATGNEKNRDALYTNAEGLRQKSKPKPISTMPEIPGVMLFIASKSGKVGHVGLYCGGGVVAEAHGFKQVDVWPIKNQKWEYWGESPWIAYSAAEKAAMAKARGETPAAPSSAFNTGDRVRVKSGAKEYYPGLKMPEWVPGKSYTISQVTHNGNPKDEGGKACVLLKELVTWCDAENLELLEG